MGEEGGSLVGACLRPWELNRAMSPAGTLLPRPIQCRNDGQSCWCVDAEGTEVPGSRQPRRPVACEYGGGMVGMSNGLGQCHDAPPISNNAAGSQHAPCEHEVRGAEAPSANSTGAPPAPPSTPLQTSQHFLVCDERPGMVPKFGTWLKTFQGK